MSYQQMAVIDRLGTLPNNTVQRKLTGLFRDLVTYLALLGHNVIFDSTTAPMQLGYHQNYNQNDVAILYFNPLRLNYDISGDKLVTKKIAIFISCRILVFTFLHGNVKMCPIE